MGLLTSDHALLLRIFVDFHTSSHSFTFFPAVRYLCFSSIVVCRIRSVPRNKGLRRGKQFAGGHRVSGEYEQQAQTG